MTTGMIVSALTGLGALIVGLVILHFSSNEPRQSKRPRS
jgi:hypothetical protein